jgi:hypothetical protein
MSLLQAILVRQALPGDAACVGQLRLEALHAHPEFVICHSSPTQAVGRRPSSIVVRPSSPKKGASLC